MKKAADSASPPSPAPPAVAMAFRMNLFASIDKIYNKAPDEPAAAASSSSTSDSAAAGIAADAASSATSASYAPLLVELRSLLTDTKRRMELITRSVKRAPGGRSHAGSARGQRRGRRRSESDAGACRELKTRSRSRSRSRSPPRTRSLTPPLFRCKERINELLKSASSSSDTLLLGDVPPPAAVASIGDLLSQLTLLETADDVSIETVDRLLSAVDSCTIETSTLT